MFLAWSDTLAKYLAAELPVVQIGWIRFSVFLLVMLPVIVSARPNAMRSSRPSLQLLRGTALVASSLLFIGGLVFLPIAEATATAFVSPLFVTTLSVIFLGEIVGVRRWAATVVGLIGVLVIVRPGTSAFHPATILPILSALAWAMTIVITRKISGSDRVITTMCYAAVVGFALLSLVVPFWWVTPTPKQLAVAVGIGLTSTMGHWVVVMAFRHADASVLAPFSYTHLLWVTLLGYWLFGDVPDAWTLSGAAIIIASGIYTAQRERSRRLKPAEPAEPLPGA